MKLYKFRSFEKIERTLDIISKERFFCARHQDLNDPFEGLFSTIEYKETGTVGSPIGSPVGSPIGSPFSHPSPRSSETIYKSVNELPSLKREVRVCSLSNELSDIRMWSYYAAGHTGLAIEIDIHKGELKDLYEVEYSNGLKSFASKLSSDTKAHEVLSFKTNHWAHEKEFRVITDDEFIPIDRKITAIYLGLRVKNTHKEMIKRSVQNEIPIYEMRMEYKSVSIIPGKRLN